MMLVRWDYMIKNNPLFGLGFKGSARDLVSGDLSGEEYVNRTSTSGHNFIGDLAVRYGLSGFLIFGWILIAVFQKAARLLKTLSSSWQKSLVCGLLAFNVQALLVSYGGDSLYLSVYGAVTMASSWAMLELIDRFHKREYITRDQISY